MSVEYDRKDYKLSRDAKELIKAIQKSPVKDGKVQLSGRTIDAMIKKGAIKPTQPKDLPKDHTKGGWK